MDNGVGVRNLILDHGSALNVHLDPAFGWQEVNPFVWVTDGCDVTILWHNNHQMVYKIRFDPMDRVMVCTDMDYLHGFILLDGNIAYIHICV